MHHFARDGRTGQKGRYKSSPARIFMTVTPAVEKRDPFYTCINDGRRAIRIYIRTHTHIYIYIAGRNNIHAARDQLHF